MLTRVSFALAFVLASSVPVRPASAQQVPVAAPAPRDPSLARDHVEPASAVPAPPPSDPLTLHATAPGVELGFSPDEGAFVRNADRSFSLQIGLLVQVRYQLSSTPDPARESEFIVRMVRPQLRGTVLAPWIRYVVQAELAGTGARLLDLQIDVQPHEAIGLRVGQFLTPFSRTFTTPVPRLLFPDFSIANDAFRADRDTGAMIFGTPFDGLFEYDVGVFNGNRIDQGGNDDDEMLYMARLVASPLGRVALDETPALAAHVPFRVSIGVNGYLGEITRTEPRVDATTGLPTTATLGIEHQRTLGADVAAQWETLAFQAEIYYRDATLVDGTTRDAIGGYAHLAWMFFRPYLDVAARVSVVDPDLATAGDVLRVVEGLIDFYALGNHLKLQLRYANTTDERQHETARATIHSGTLQTQLAF
ncbi:porin [Sandaracinus amylolyticus]|uniref:Phosphate-selective porin O and P n=1 Tax=Sandaracinus amylolyticus TaxID=927083 RepID=A0A0F6YFU1_9BACT|nr:porin [Sandaracinus amylolyticus]AKF04038.1 phosphate-selective porin O and P [Sandaracinus amylolyticus]